jgi:hypothetical protein
MTTTEQTAFIPAPPLKSLEDVAAVAQETLAAAKESLEGLVKVSQQQAQKQYDETVAVAQAQLGTTQAQLTKGYENLTNYSKGNVDAVVASGTILAKGVEDILKTVLSLSKASFDKYVAISTASLAVKSIGELSALSNDFAKAYYQTLLADAALVQELVATVANEAVAPISARVNLTVEKFAKPLAA